MKTDYWFNQNRLLSPLRFATAGRFTTSPLYQFKATELGCKRARCPTVAGVLILLLLGYFALSRSTQAVVPAPDGGYPNGNTAEGTNALFNLTNGVNNTGLGFQALYHNRSGNSNTAVGAYAAYNGGGSWNTAVGMQALNYNTASTNSAFGFRAMFRNTSGARNVSLGYQALLNSTTGSNNTAVGSEALLRNTTGFTNTAIGVNALDHNTTGIYNIALGDWAGSHIVTGSNNIAIGVDGLVDESDTIRIGSSSNERAFVGGIYGVHAGGPTLPVYINSGGKLGSAPPSARRFKKEIKSMAQASEAILSLKPVTFYYKSDTTGTPQFGLIAEEVAQVNPDLVLRDKKGEIYTVRYEAVNAMLLNEFLKEHRKIVEQNRRIQEQEATVAQLESAMIKQQKGMEVLTAHLKEQDSKIEKVSAQLKLSKPSPQTVLNK